jgi:hypothetical protein
VDGIHITASRCVVMTFHENAASRVVHHGDSTSHDVDRASVLAEPKVSAQASGQAARDRRLDRCLPALSSRNSDSDRNRLPPPTSRSVVRFRSGPALLRKRS